MTKLIYIGGYGRSGSTLLEYLLTASPSLVACGEIMRHVKRFRRKQTCTCGRPPKDCPVWGPFQRKSKQLPDGDHEDLTLALLARLAGDYSAVIDGSKTAWGSFAMPFRLRKRLGRDFLLLHIIRDPRAVCWSTIRTARKHQDSRLTSAPILRGLRTAIGWSLANIAAELFGRRHPELYMRVTYEELTRSPETTLRKILHEVSVPPPANLEHDRFDNRHQLYGNSMRFKPLSLGEVREDVAWKNEMPAGIRRLATGVCWPVGARYGYFS